VFMVQVLYLWDALTRVRHTIGQNNMVVGQGPDQVGGLMVFGMWLTQTKPGLVYAPRWITSYQADSINIQQKEIPGDLPERYPPPSGEDRVVTLRMTSAPTEGETTSPDEEQVKAPQDPLATGRLTLEVSVAVSYRLSDAQGEYQKFVRNVGSEDRFLQIADDEIVSLLRQEVARHTPSQIYTQWQQIEHAAENALKRRVGGFGFEEIRVTVKGFEVPKRVNEAFADRTAASINVGTERQKGMQTLARETLVAQANEKLAAADVNGVINAIKEANPGVVISEDDRMAIARLVLFAKTLPSANATYFDMGGGGLVPAMLGPLLEKLTTNKTVATDSAANSSSKAASGDDAPRVDGDSK